MKVPQFSKKTKFITGGAIGTLASIWIPAMIGVGFDVGPGLGLACIATALGGVIGGCGAIIYGITEL